MPTSVAVGIPGALDVLVTLRIRFGRVTPLAVIVRDAAPRPTVALVAPGIAAPLALAGFPDGHAARRDPREAGRDADDRGQHRGPFGPRLRPVGRRDDARGGRAVVHQAAVVVHGGRQYRGDRNGQQQQYREELHFCFSFL